MDAMSMDAAREQARAEAERSYRAYQVIGRQCSPEAREILAQASALMDDLAGIKREIHTIPVPQGWSVEQAWEGISRGERLADELRESWANVLIRDGKFVEVLDA